MTEISTRIGFHHQKKIGINVQRNILDAMSVFHPSSRVERRPRAEERSDLEEESSDFVKESSALVEERFDLVEERSALTEESSALVEESSVKFTMETNPP